ncbi:MAG: MFS transporter [Acidobacteriota bacterium]
MEATTKASAHDTPSKWTVLAIVAVGVFMCTLDTSIVNVSLPAIAGYFGVPVGSEIEWVIIAYLVIIASTLLVVGRLADRIGRKPIWMAGLIVFTLGSTLCGAAPTLWLLVAARVLQGIGGSLLMAVSPALLVGAFPANERGRALGMNATVVALGITTGPPLGGTITASASWRWIFYVNVPIGLAGLIATWLKLPRDRPRPERQRFDVAGAFLLGFALAALTVALSVGNVTGWGSWQVAVLAAVFVVAGAAFVIHERRHDAPLLDAKLFQNRLFASASASQVLSFIAGFATAFLLPVYLEQLRGFGLAHTGVLLTAFPIVVAVLAPISGHTADRIGTRGLAATGMAVLCVGLVLMGCLGADSPEWQIIGVQVVAAIGMAVFQSPNNSAIMGAAPRDRQGVAAGMLATGRTTGQSISVAVAGAVFVSLGGAAAGRALLQHHGEPQLVARFLRGFSWALWTCAAISAIAIVTSLLRGREQR